MGPLPAKRLLRLAPHSGRRRAAPHQTSGEDVADTGGTPRSARARVDDASGLSMQDRASASARVDRPPGTEGSETFPHTARQAPQARFIQ
ncbi:hypothetical protein ROA7023_00914 [Roseisalinus antarcticus]|uniref:Uncharacterized protein n=1 Tax=Roseisalinus antarcticus TaxID=254357 RepID=A0A1Y5RZP6_9RHOB|nr:hypothetical protein ROA7023_00914 [Roseisalinus antarcticus]